VPANGDDELTARLEEVVAALRVLASTVPSDTAQTIAERREAVRAAGCAFEELLVLRCVSYTLLFDDDESDGWADDEDQDEDDDDQDDGGGGLPPGARLSVRVREDFVVEDEQAFHDSAMRLLAERGPWPPPGDAEHSAAEALTALVDEFGLHEITFGTTVAGLRNAGGETAVTVVDEALQDDPYW
jgi:hypothetical protein